MLTPSGSNPRVKTLRDWDYATLTKEKFLAKYGASAKEYAQPVAKETVASKPSSTPVSTEKLKPVVSEVVFHPTPPIRVNGERTR